jgi:phosphopantothenoylcysteine decarboxylase/phosphopantothenate--cysteine ligase
MKKILLILTGSIAAYKMLDAIRLFSKQNIAVTCVITESAKQFVTPLSLASLSENPVYDNLFSLKDETEMGHIRLSREHDLILVAPASADIIAKITHGLANDLASTLLMAANCPIYVAPAMNVEMWNNKAVQRNVAQAQADGIHFIGPESGELACKEQGYGRMSEPEAIVDHIVKALK